jgi:hypothetical protein
MAAGVAGCYLGPAGGRDNLRWMRQNTQAAGLAALCDDVCCMVIRYCEERHIAVYVAYSGTDWLFTAPIRETIAEDAFKRYGRGIPGGANSLYYDSRRLVIEQEQIVDEPGIDSKILCIRTESRLLAPICGDTRNTEAIPLLPFAVGEIMGEIGEEISFWFTPNGGRLSSSFRVNTRIVKGFPHDTRHGRVLYVNPEKDSIIFENMQEGTTLAKSAWHEYRSGWSGFVLDQNTFVTVEEGGFAELVDIRGSSSRFYPNGRGYYLCPPRREGDDIVHHSSIDDENDGAIFRERFDVASRAWVPFWATKIPRFSCDMSTRGYWG